MGWIIGKIKGGFKCLREHGIRYTAALFAKKVWNKVKKIPRYVNNGLAKLGKRLELGFITVIKAKTYVKDDRYGKVYFVFLFGKQIYPRKKKYRPCSWADPRQPVIYFKINRMSDYAKPCVQHWVNIAYHMKADYYFICDNTQLQYHLLRTVNFPGAEIKFIPSIRRPLKRLCKIIDPGKYRNANMACAHLSPFYYAKRKEQKQFWAIDADDTMICLHHWRVAQALKSAQNYAKENEISTFSLDMWRSRTLGRHWSWGVAFVQDNVNFVNLFEQIDKDWWREKYQDVYKSLNIDWLFSYLKSDKIIKIDTFYFEKVYLIHWGNFLRNPLLGAVFYWNNGKIIFPIFKYIFQCERLGVINIADCIKIDFNATQREGIDFLENEVSCLKSWTPEIRKLNNGGNFSTREKSIENL